MLRSHLTGTRLGLVLAIGAGVMLGAVFGQPGNGQAAATVAPKNKTLPTISGSPVIGATLTATRGTWSGTPTSFRFQWARCDGTGTGCLAISGATAKIYTVTNADVNHAFRVTVTARNASGATDASSAATTPVPLSGCPFGTSTIQVADVSPPAQLQIVGASVAPALKRSTSTIRLSFKIQACGRPVQGALVYASTIPFNQFKAASVATGANGTVTITQTRLGGFPAAHNQRLLAVFVRATKPGDPLLGGVSARRVVAFRIAH